MNSFIEKVIAGNDPVKLAKLQDPLGTAAQEGPDGGAADPTMYDKPKRVPKPRFASQMRMTATSRSPVKPVYKPFFKSPVSGTEPERTLPVLPDME